MSPTRRMRIGIDFDGTLADSIGAAVAYLAEFDDIVLPAEERRWPPGRGRIGPDRFNEMITDRRFFDRLSLVPGAEPVMRELTRYADVFLITARDSQQARPVRDWLDDHGLSFKGIETTAYTSKAATCHALQLDVHFDDMLAHTAEIPALTDTALALLAAPWNELRPGPLPPGEPDARVFAGWLEFGRWLHDAYADRLPAA